MTSETPLQAAKARLDLLEVARSYGLKLRRAGAGRFACLCPVHEENTPSCHLHTSGAWAGRWKCYGCDAHGDALDLLAILARTDLAGAVRLANDQAGTMPQIRPEILPEIKPKTPPDAELYQAFVTAAGMPEIVGRYAAGRGLLGCVTWARLCGVTPASFPAIRAGLVARFGADRVAASGIDAFRGGTWLVMPYIWKGDIIHLQGRRCDQAGPNKYAHLTGRSIPVFNADAVRGARRNGRALYVCEGAINALTWELYNVPACATGSASTLQTWLIQNVAGLDVVFDLDKDQAGLNAWEKHRETLLSAGARSVEITRGEADANELHMRSLPLLDQAALLAPEGSNLAGLVNRFNLTFA